MPKRTDVKKVLVIGSGPIVIGQAAEFDYAGTQACMSLQEEGCEVVLVNNNPATVMTDEQYAQTIYFEPLTVESITEIIKIERPDAILGTAGGQTGLNLTVELFQKGILEKYNIIVLGTQPESIIKGEDRDAFRTLMKELGEPVPDSEIIHTAEEAVLFAEEIGYPVIVRPAYTLGGGGGGIAADRAELMKIVKRGLDASPISQCLIEKSIAGFKELEFEMMRDEKDTCIAICSMENFDPVGVHTGDSIVIAPQQTLTEEEYKTLYNSSVRIIRALGIVGGCNIQFAQDPNSSQYYLIEVNPRLSRSSALASKATGYPIAKIAAKLGMGYHLSEITNPVSGTVKADQEPIVDYTVVKMPRWPFDKFPAAERKLGTQMKATGEIMAIESRLSAAFQKAVRSLELGVVGLELKEVSGMETEKLWHSVKFCDDLRFFSILELMRRGVSASELEEATLIHRTFLDCLAGLVVLESRAKQASADTADIRLMKELKQHGFSDSWLADIWERDIAEIRQIWRQQKLQPAFLKVDSCGGEQAAEAPYYYSSWNVPGAESKSGAKPKIAILGSGPVRIGQGLEFDYCTVHAVLALKKAGYETILINNNPGTVSTDSQIADRLYFDPLQIEDVLNVLEYEQPDGVLVQFGGQTAINLAHDLEQHGIPLLGITQDLIDICEDRDRFYELLKNAGIPHIPGLTASSKEDLHDKANSIGYPMLLRPSYVIGGQGMLIIQSEEELKSCMENIQFPVLLDAYYKGTEFEIDVLTDGHDIFVPGIFEHIEKAGVHSGDSIAITPPVQISAIYKELAFEYAKKLAKHMGFVGIFNIQYVLYQDVLYVMEVNPRASRTVPVISKVTGINIIEDCVKVLTGLPMKRKGAVEASYYTVKYPVFSTGKLPGVDPLLAPEMKSTGELMAFGKSPEEALTKAVNWNGYFSDAATGASVFIEDGEDFDEILSLVEGSGAQAVYGIEGTEFKKWLKASKGAIIASTGRSRNSIDTRCTAALYPCKVITDIDTLRVHLSGMANKAEAPLSLQSWLANATGKEKVIR